MNVKPGNPHKADWLNDHMIETLDSIDRLDEDGILYGMEYTADYRDPAVMNVVCEVNRNVSAGCSAFSTYSTNREFLLCRNYDYIHRDDSGNTTGLMVVIRMAPEGKLRSLNICDAYWINQNAYYAGTLDDGVTDTSLMIAAPFMCVDGMNEAGVSASLLYIDTKNGESNTDQSTGKEKLTHSMLLRYVMDNACDVDEAVGIAEGYDICSAGGADLHVYLSDRRGNSAVLEWRRYGNNTEQKLYVTYTNALTNFFVGFDDGADVYYEDGSLRELFAGQLNTFNNYRYGYGHGYHRYNQMVAALERYISDEADKHGIRNSVMSEVQAKDILRVVSQDPGTEHTSYTQYSAIYNLEKCSVDLWIQRNYDKTYTLMLNE